MSNSAILKSSLAKKYWMAATGLFLCLFLVGHLAGNLQLLKGGFEGQLAFNEYALFMTTNPAVKILSYITYISILFHAIDGIMLTIQNKAARPEKYAKENAAANSKWTSRNMSILGTIILIFIITHMANFWAKMHFEKLPLTVTTISQTNPQTGEQIETKLYVTTKGDYMPVDTSANSRYVIEGTEIYQKVDETQTIKVGEGTKDLHSIVMAFFGRQPVGSEFEVPVNQYGTIAAVGYAIAMLVLMLHLLHGFASAFQSLGINHAKHTPIIKSIGKLFAVVVSIGFAIIPLYIAFLM